MSICFNCGRLMPEDFKYCTVCGTEANDKFNRVFKCIRENIGRTPIYLIMTYSGLSREQAVSYLEKLKTLRYVTGNIRDGYLITAAGAGIFKEKEQGKMASLEKNKAIIRSLYEAFNKHNPALLDELLAPDFIDAPNTPFELRGLENYKRFEATFIKAFPDYQDIIEDIIAEGDKVWVVGKVTGTHTGKWEFMGITFAPTGKKITATTVNIFHMVNGKIMERKSVNDMLDFLRQLSVIEYTEKGKKLFPENVK